MQLTFLGVSPTLLALLMAALTGGTLLLVLGMGARNPLLIRVGLRNMVRRPPQTAVMIAGLTLSAVFITASFGMQDSLTASTVTSRLAQVGWVDETVSGTFTQNQVNSTLARMLRVPGVQSATSIFMGQAQVASDVTASSLTEFGVPSNFAQTYGPLIDSQGQTIHLADLSPDEIVLSHTGGLLLGLRPGEKIQFKTTFGSVTRTVRAILRNDFALTTGEVAANLSFAEIIMPLGDLQHLYEQQFHHPLVPNIICIKNVGQGGLDDSGPGDSRSQAVLRVLQQIFGVAPIYPQAPHATHFPTDFDTIQIHPLKPTVVEDTGGLPLISNKGELIGSPAARQFFLLLPVFTCLLVGAGLLLLALLVLLLAAERRSELGMARAIGLQRQDLVLSLLIEGGGYAVAAALLGVPLGVGVLALELLLLSHLPTVGLPLGGAQSAQAPLYLSLSWQSAVLSGSLAVLTTVLVVLASAMWISRMNVVAAIRDLDEPTYPRLPLLHALRGLRMPPRDALGQLIPETPARRFARKMEAIGQCIVGLVSSGSLCLVFGTGLLLWSRELDQNWMEQCSVLLLIAGGGLMVSCLLPRLPVPATLKCDLEPLLRATASQSSGSKSSTLARRLGSTGIGIGWLLSGLHFGLPDFLAAFAPNASAANIGYLSPSLLQKILSTFSPLIGVVILVMSNVDLLVDFLTMLLRRVRRLAPVSRLSLVFPLTFRVRTGVTLALVSLITFLVMLVVTNNLSTVQQSQVQITTGNFQLALDVDAQTNQRLGPQLLATPQRLPDAVAAVALLTPLYNVQQGQFLPISLSLPGHPRYPVPGPTIASNAFLSLTTMPMFARARGFASDQAVWEAVRDHPGDAVLQYQGGIGLATSDGFSPFTATIFTGNSQHTVSHVITIIGIVPNNTHWSTVFLSNQTAARVGLSLTGSPSTYCFRLQPGVDVAQVSRILGQTFHLGEHGLSLTMLGTQDQDAYTQTLTVFLASYLGLGLLFGAFSIGVISSRAVIERRQLIGMLRALGFSRQAVRGSFLIEASFVITLSLLMGSVLAWWLVSQVASQFARNVPVPLEAILLLLGGSYLMILLCTVVPARRASRIPPAEALRSE